jgi:hypothetical protein
VFYAHVFHPEFNLDADDCLEVVDRFERHVREVDTRVDGLRTVMGQFREARNSKQVPIVLYTRTKRFYLSSNVKCPKDTLFGFFVAHYREPRGSWRRARRLGLGVSER